MLHYISDSSHSLHAWRLQKSIFCWIEFHVVLAFLSAFNLHFAHAIHAASERLWPDAVHIVVCNERHPEGRRAVAVVRQPRWHTMQPRAAAEVRVVQWVLHFHVKPVVSGLGLQLRSSAAYREVKCRSIYLKNSSHANARFATCWHVQDDQLMRAAMATLPMLFPNKTVVECPLATLVRTRSWLRSGKHRHLWVMPVLTVQSFTRAAAPLFIRLWTISNSYLQLEMLVYCRSTSNEVSMALKRVFVLAKKAAKNRRRGLNGKVIKMWITFIGI